MSMAYVVLETNGCLDSYFWEDTVVAVCLTLETAEAKVREFKRLKKRTSLNGKERHTPYHIQEVKLFK